MQKIFLMGFESKVVATAWDDLFTRLVKDEGNYFSINLKEYNQILLE